MSKASSASLIAPARMQPELLVVLGAALTVVLALLLGWAAWGVEVAEDREQSLHDLRGALVQVAALEESGTRAARMAAVTEDLRWEERYEEIASSLMVGVQRVLGLAPLVEREAAAERLQAATRAMAAMEDRAFSLVARGQAADALRLLSGEAYNDQKESHSRATHELSSAAAAEVQAYHRSVEQRVLWTLLLAAVAVVALLLLWGFVLARLRGYLSQRDRAEAQLQEREHHFRTLIENSHDIVTLIDAAGVIRYASPSVERMLGYTPGELLGEKLLSLLHADDTPMVMAALREGFSHPDRTLSREHRFRHKDGSWRWLQSTSSKRITGLGEPVAVINSRDITQARQTAEALRQNEERLQALVDASPLPITILDLEGRVVLWNPAAERLFGWTRDEVLGRPYRVVPEDQQEEHLALRERAFRGTPLTGVEVERQRKDGTRVQVRLSTAPLRDREGEVTGSMAVLENVTALKEVQGELEMQRVFLRAVIDSSPSGVFVKDAQGRYTLANVAMAGFFGLTPQQMVGRVGTELGILPEQVGRFERMDQAVMETGEAAFSPAEPLTSPDTGETRWLETRKVPLAAPGRGRQVLGIVTDVSDRHEAEERERQLIREQAAREEAETAQERIRDILESITDAFFAVDERWLFTYVNSRVEALTGTRAEELLGRSLWDQLPMPPDNPFWTELHRAVEEQVPVEFEAFGPNTGIWASVRAYPREEGLTVYVRDIGKRKQAEAAADLKQRRLHAVLDALPVSVFVADVDGKIVDTNEAARRIWETADLPLSESVDEYGEYRAWWPGTGQRLEPREWGMARALAGEPVDEQELVIETFAGTKKTILNYTRPIYDGAGELVGAVSAIVDITERKKVAEALHESELTLQTILAASPDVIELLSLDGRFRWISPAVREVLDYGADEVQGQLMQDLLHPDDRDPFAARLQALAEGRTAHVRLRYRARHADGHWVKMEGRGRAVTNESVRGLVLVARDVTEQEQLMASLQQAKEEAEAANRAKSELLSRTSHELRTPLNAILGFAQIMEVDVEREEDRESVEQILKAGRHLLGLVDEVLDIARADSGEMELPTESVHIGEAVEEMLPLVRPLADRRRIELPQNPLSTCDARVLGDPQRLRQVVLSLLSNAVQYNREGGRVEVTCEEVEGGRVRIRVRDTGPGIAPEKLSRLFDPFDRLDAEKSATTEVQGTGLGLALAKALVEAMHGRIGAESTPGAGSVFWIELPLDAADAAEPQSWTTTEAADRRTEDGVAATPVVLYVDDEPANLRLVERILRRTRPGVELITATQAAGGLELARQRRPDLILLDRNLPDMRGEEMLEALREEASTRDIPVVMLSAEAGLADAERLREEGVIDSLAKPFVVSRLVDVVSSIIDRHE